MGVHPPSDTVPFCPPQSDCLAAGLYLIVSDGPFAAWVSLDWVDPALTSSGLSGVKPRLRRQRPCIALKIDVTFTIWWIRYGQNNIPAAEYVIAIAAWGYHNLALKSDRQRLQQLGVTTKPGRQIPLRSHHDSHCCGIYWSLL